MLFPVFQVHKNEEDCKSHRTSEGPAKGKSPIMKDTRYIHAIIAVWSATSIRICLLRQRQFTGVGRLPIYLYK